MSSHKRRWIIEEYEDSYSLREESSKREIYGVDNFSVIMILVHDLAESTDYLKHSGIEFKEKKKER